MTVESLTERPLETVARAGLIVLLSSSIAYALKFIARILLARILGPQGFGEFSTGMAIYTFLSLFAGLGIPVAVTKLIPASRAEERKRIAAASLIAVTMSSALVVALSLLTVDIFSELFNVQSSLVVPFVFVVFFDLLFSTVRGITIGYGDPWVRVWLTDVGLAFAYIFIVVGAALLYNSPVAAAYAFLLSVALLTILALFYSVRKKYIAFLGVSLSDAQRIVGYALPFLLIAISSLVFTWSDVLVISAFRSPTDVGIYRAAVTLVYALGFVVSASTVLLLPTLSALYARGNLQGVCDVYGDVFRKIAVMLAPISAIFLVFGKQVLYYIFGPEYVAAYSPLVVLALLMYVSYVLSLSASVLVAIDQERLISKVMLLAAIVNIVLDVLFLQFCGIVGVAVATGISLLVANAYFFFQLGRHKIHADWRIVIIALAIALISTLPVSYVVKYLSGIPAILVGFMVYFPLYSLLMLVAGIVRFEDIRRLLALLLRKEQS